MQLSGSQRQSLLDALLNAFAADELRRMVRLRLGENLAAITSGTNLTTTVFELIEWAERQGRLTELIHGAARENPGNPKLRAWIEAHAPEPSSDNEPENSDSTPPAETLDQHKDKFTSFEAKIELVDALLACPKVQDRHVRDQIVSHLPEDIRDSIVRNESAQVDVMNIVTRVLDFSGGLATLLTRVRFYEGGSVPMAEVEQLVEG